jgi:membrane peptidoglycan carboxypeptidase
VVKKLFGKFAMSMQVKNLTRRKLFFTSLDSYCKGLLLSLRRLQHPYAVLIGVIFFTLLSIRFRSDAVLASPFLRAFVGRGVMVAAALGLMVTVCTLIKVLVQKIFSGQRWSRQSPEVKRRVSKVVPALFISAALGFTANIVFTLVLAHIYDNDIQARANAVDQLEYFVTLHYPGDSRPLILRRRADGSYVHRVASLEQVTPIAKGMLRAAEDRRQQCRVDSVDLIGRLRAAISLVGGALFGRKSVQGGSPISEQLAGLLFDVQPYREQTFATRLQAKIVKMLVGTRVDDLYARDEQVRLYLSCVSFGSFGGHEVEGLGEAAHAFYAVEPGNLTPAQLADLLARVQSPYEYFPYQRPDESPEHFAVRHRRHEARALWILESSRKEGVLNEDEERQAQKTLFYGLRPANELREYLSRPGLYVIFRELGRRTPGITRHLDVTVGLDVRAQGALDNAVSEARNDLAMVVGQASIDRVAIDAVVLGETGAIRASSGLYTTPGDGASQYKGEIYAEALSRGLITSMSDDVLPGMSGTQALAHSDNKAAESLAGRVGLEFYQAHLEGQGLRVTGPYPSIALGAGVDGSPLTAAAMFAKFGYVSPGAIFEDPSLIAEVREAGSGQLVFAPVRRQVFPQSVCTKVRQALETCALSGTAHRLASLAKDGNLNAKTGTSAFRKNGVLVGNGGSWILINDDPSRSTIAVRVRWQSGRPFAPEGGQSAALVISHLLPRLRAIN